MVDDTSVAEVDRKFKVFVELIKQAAILPCLDEMGRFLKLAIGQAAPNRDGGLATGLDYFVDDDKMELTVGYPDGSDLALVALYQDMGTGERGRDMWTQFFDEPMPTWTIPHGSGRDGKKVKTMHWFSTFTHEPRPKMKANEWFAKTIKGVPPTAFMRGTLFASVPYLQQMVKRHFGAKNVEARLKKGAS